jgi:general secretion pathway protein D
MPAHHDQGGTPRQAATPARNWRGAPPSPHPGEPRLQPVVANPEWDGATQAPISRQASTAAPDIHPVKASPPPSNRPTRQALRALSVVAALASTSCTPHRIVEAPPVLSPLPPLGVDAGRASPRISGPVSTSQAYPRVAVSTVPGASISLGAQRGAQGGGTVTLDFADTDIREVAAQILGNSLHVNYTIDPSVHGTATLRTVVPLTQTQLIPVLQSLLQQNGATLVETGNVYRVLPVAAAAGIAGGPGTAGGTMIPLRYAAAEDLAKALQPYAQGGARVVGVPASNALIISGEPAQRDALADLVRAFDIDALAGQSYALFPVDSGAATDFADALKQAFRAQQGGTLASQIRVVPMARVNAVLVIANAPGYITQARRAFEVVERGRRQTMRSWHVYYLQNGTANDVAYVLQSAFTPSSVTAQPSPRATGQGGSSQMTGISSISSFGSSGSSGGGSSSGGSALGGLTGGSSGSTLGGGGTTGASTGSGAQGTPTAPGSGSTGSNPLLGGIGNSGGSGAPDQNTMRIIPNPDNNAILIYGTGEEEDTVEAMLHKIDILPLQVRIDAVIAEVTLNDNLAYGTQFFFKHHSLNGGLVTEAANAVTGAFSATNPATPGFGTPNGTINVGGASGDLVLQALQDVTTVKVLSSPELLVLDNETAQLQVGNSVPIQNGTLSTVGSAIGTVSSTSYVNTGVITQVTPRVNSGGLVTLDVQQEVSAVLPSNSNSSGSSINSPTFSDRAVKSRIVVQDGQTVGLAGLITDNVQTENQGLPWLKDIPILGLLTGNQNNTRSRTELLILLTPHVLHDQRDARALTEDLREMLPRAAMMPDEVNHLRQGGSADPQENLRRRLGLQPN